MYLKFKLFIRFKFFNLFCDLYLQEKKRQIKKKMKNVEKLTKNILSLLMIHFVPMRSK